MAEDAQRREARRQGGKQTPTPRIGSFASFRYGAKHSPYFLGDRSRVLLLPLICNSAPARIVNVASAGQQRIDFSDVMLTRGYDGMRAYCQSKLALVMFTFDLSESLKGSGVTVNCPAPGDSHEHQNGHRKRLQPAKQR